MPESISVKSAKITEHQFVEYISVDSPGTKLVSFREDPSQIFLRDNVYGIVFYVAIQGINPSRIEVAPRFKLDLTLLSTSASEGIVKHTLTPKPRSDLLVVDVIFNGHVIKEDGTRVAFNKPLEQLDILPAMWVEGHLYFEVAKAKNQFPASHRLYIA